jgi:hypothetical protein
MLFNLCHKRRRSLGIHWGFTGDSVGIHWGFIGETLHICSIMHNILILLHISNILIIYGFGWNFIPRQLARIGQKGKFPPKLENDQRIANLHHKRTTFERPVFLGCFPFQVSSSLNLLGGQIELGHCVPARFALQVKNKLEPKSSWDTVSQLDLLFK